MLKKYTAVFLTMVLFSMIGCSKQKSPGQPEFSAAVETIDSMFVASVALVGPYADAGKSMGLLMGWVEKNKIVPAGGPFGVYYDDPTKVKPESTRYELCIPVPAETKGDKQIKVKQIGPINIVAAIHVGPYDKIGMTYGKLAQWIASNNFQIAGPAYEFYIDDPIKVPAESLKTKVAFPIKK